MSPRIETHRGIDRPDESEANSHMNVKVCLDRFGIASGYPLEQAGLYYRHVVRLDYGRGGGRARSGVWRRARVEQGMRRAASRSPGARGRG